MSDLIIPVGREEVKLPMEYMQMLAVLANTSDEIDVGLHCSLCNQNIVGRNSSADKRWIMECECRTFVGTNPIKGR